MNQRRTVLVCNYFICGKNILKDDLNIVIMQAGQSSAYQSGGFSHSATRPDIKPSSDTPTTFPTAR